MHFNIRRFIICMAAAAVTVSCSDVERSAGRGSILVRIADGGSLTKGGTGSTAAEEAFVSARIFLFDEAGHLYRSRLAEGCAEVRIDSVADGRYTVSVAANMPDLEADSLRELEAGPVSLGDSDPEGSFAMYGRDSVRMAGGQTQALVQVRRYPSRIRLTKVVNATGVDVTLNGVMLINVRDAWTVAAALPATGWANLAGRVDGQVITAATAEHPALTYRDAGDRLLAPGDSLAPQWQLYCLPNGERTDEYGPQAAGGKTRLVVDATIGGTRTYYPVTIDPQDGMVRNASYDVELTMLSYGSADPNVLTPTGAMTSRVTVEGYDIIDYNENI